MSGLPRKLCGFAGLGLIAASSCAAPGAQTSRDQPAPVASVAPARPALVTPTRTRGYAQGERYRYAAKLSTAVRFHQDQTVFDFDLVGHVELTPVSITAEEVCLYATMEDARVVNRTPEKEEELEQLTRELRASGGFFTLSGDRLSELRVPEALSPMAATVYRHVAAGLQFAHAPDDSRRYTVEEYDATGRYLADYERGATSNVWRKSKQRYTKLLSHTASADVSTSAFLPEIVRSQGEVRLTANGRPEHVKLIDELILKGAQVPVASTVGIELEAKPPLPVRGTPDLASLLTRTRRYLAEEPVADPTAARALDDARIGTLDFDTIVRELEKLSRAQKPVVVSDDPAAVTHDPTDDASKRETTAEEARLFGALAALFRKEPGAVTRAAALVRAKSPVASVVMDALGSASTPEAHRALASLLAAKSGDAETRGRIIHALARVRKPTAEATLALKSVLEKEPFQAGALYGLGTHARLLRDDGRTAEASALGEFLTARLTRAVGRPSLVTVLRAIANSGYDGALARVRPYLDDERDAVRSAAVRALQSMRDPSVDRLIAARLGDDASKDVRLSAIAAARLREPNDALANAVAGAGSNAAEPHIRYRAVETMARWVTKRPALRDTLERIARNDTEERIRERARQAL
jgi:hypothetical protein